MNDNNNFIKWFFILFTPIGWIWLIYKGITGLSAGAVMTTNTIVNGKSDIDKDKELEEAKERHAKKLRELSTTTTIPKDSKEYTNEVMKLWKEYQNERKEIFKKYKVGIYKF